MDHGQERPSGRSYQQVISETIEAMRDVEVAPPDGQDSLTDPSGEYATMCFEMAWLYLVTHDDVEGIHYVVGEAFIGGFGLHAWVELPNDVVFDGVMQRFYRRAAYYSRQNVKVYYRYTAAAALEISHALDRELGDKVSWLWHNHLGLPWSQACAPLLIDSDLAGRLLAAKGIGTGKVPFSRQRKTT